MEVEAMSEVINEVNDEVIEPSEGLTDSNIDINSLLNELEQAKAEAAKNRNIKQQLVKERDQLRDQLKTKEPSKDDDYKQLYQAQLEENKKIIADRKNETISNTIKQKLMEQGLESEKEVKAALKLIDKGLIDFEDTDIDEVGINAAVLQLRKDYDFLFEKTIPASKPKLPSDKVPTSEKTISRADFDRLDVREQALVMQKKGMTII